MIVPTLRVGMPHWTLRVRFWDAERPWLHSHAERGNDQEGGAKPPVDCAETTNPQTARPSAAVRGWPVRRAHWLR
ncbi:hypothetical protein C1Y11_09705 [Pseudomonas sp. FW305-20]|nr:hypothetical protein C1Y11_09705 [Pseudomonas sp. FW305-20]PMU20564.1 hypothetical protein C1Y10_06040 [Pseudomonas sp. FW305-122]PMU39992.1 hypothetical protein C1Y12_11825 [Pseudomonas sp. FW305-47B]PMX63408.1 hypothetical protein C1Y13_06755 [Pseudomonas sp. FW305-33]PMX69326.1 hypothetical protein C1X12_09070 [Pseudomonas sp. FW305-60]